jgi:hypothetical protein
MGMNIAPGLNGLLAQRQFAQQEQQGQLGQIHGLLGIQQAQQQQGLLAQQMQDKQRQQMQIESFANTLPPEKRPMFLANPQAFFQEMNKRHVVEGALLDNSGTPLYQSKPKPQFQTLPVDGKPGVTQGAWVVPGQTDFTAVGGQKLPEILNPDVEAAKWRIASKGASRTDVRVTMPGDNKYIETRRGDQAKALTDLEKSAQSAYNQFNTLDRFIAASEKSFAGGAATVLAGVNNFLSSFGYNSESLKDTRVMEQAIGDILGNKMAELGARGLTDKDMQILRDALPRVETDKKSRVEIAKIIKKANANVLKEYETARNEEARIYPDLAARTPMQAWFQDYKRNPQRFGGSPVAATDSAPDGVDKSLWAVMTPEERALWKK